MFIVLENILIDVQTFMNYKADHFLGKFTTGSSHIWLKDRHEKKKDRLSNNPPMLLLGTGKTDSSAARGQAEKHCKRTHDHLHFLFFWILFMLSLFALSRLCYLCMPRLVLSLCA